MKTQEINNLSLKGFVLSILLLLIIVPASAQFSGATTVTVGETINYSYTNGISYSIVNWVATGGTTQNPTNNDPVYGVQVVWNTVGTQTLTFKWKNAVIDVLNVTVNAVPATPSGTFSYSTVCTSGLPKASVSILFSQSAPAGITYYWQTTSNGYSTSDPGSSIAAYGGETFYLRARDNASWVWSSGSIAAPVVPVRPTTTGASSCGSASLTLTANSGGAYMKWYDACSGGNLVQSGTGTTFTTPVLSTSTNYFVAAYNTTTGVEGAKQFVTAQINPAASTPSPYASPAVVCGSSGSITLMSNGATTNEGYVYYTVPSGGSPLGSPSVSLSATTTYYVSVRNSVTGCESARVPITVPVESVPASPTVTGNQRIGPGTLTLQGNGAPSGGSYQWFDGSFNYLGSGATFTTSSLSSNQTSYMYVKATSTAGCASSSVPINITINPRPVITAPQNYIVKSDPVTMSTGNYTSWQWYRAGSLIAGATSQTYQTNVNGSYTVVITVNGLSGESDPFILGPPPAQDINYIITNTLLDEETNESLVNDLPVSKANQSTVYFDGLGRPMQSVVTQGSPLKKDIVQPVAYDKFGREPIKYLPYVQDENNGWYKSGAIASQSAFYSNTADKVADNPAPYSETRFEASPLNRVLKQGAPGDTWQPVGADSFSSPDHSIKIDYQFNGSDEVLQWTYTYPDLTYPFGRVNANTGSTPNNFSANQLTKSMTRDEQGRVSIQYTNELNQVVLKRQQAGATESPIDDTNYASTYYIYDDFGNLVCVVPPAATKLLAGEYFALDDANRNTFLSRWAFRYVYDGRKRMIQKQVPGADPVYMVYDNRDRLVMTQDGNQRKDDSGNINKKDWILTKYDVHNRPVMTALYTHPTVVDQADMTTFVNLETDFYEDFDPIYPMGYTDRVFNGATLKVLSVNFYDSYEFRSLIAGPSDYSFVEDITGVLADEANVKGMVTGSRVNVLGTLDYLWSVTYYDKKTRLVQTVAQNKLGGRDRTTNELDFAGRLKQTKTVHINSSATYTTKRRLEYDHGSRVKQIYHTFNTEPEVLLTRNEYNEIGQLVTKQLHSRNSGSSFAQTTDYRYNIRGWLLTINDPGADANDLFGMALQYESPTGNGGDAQFNGNISQALWTSAGFERQSYGYYYDNLNRLKEARYFNVNSARNGRYDEKIGDATHEGYDLNGNIQFLKRNGKKDATTYGLMDELSYTYTGNRLTKVDDAITKNALEDGFKESVKTTDEYLYDFNGSVRKDQNKDISSVTYNYLNLVSKVIKNSGEYVLYNYDASGRKLSQVVYNSSDVVQKTTDYAGEFVYENSAIAYVTHDEGRIVPDVSPGAPRPWEYEYFLKDHLGNVHVTFSEKTTTTNDVATMETPTNAAFRNYGNFNTLPIFNHTQGGTTSQLLNGGYGGQIGLAKSYAVNAGDVVDMEVFAKYEAQSGTPTNLTGIFAALASAFTLNSTGGVGVDGQSAYNAFNTLFSGGPIITSGNWESSVAPKAYLNYLLFDENFVLVDFGFDQVGTTGEQVGVSPVTPHDYLNLHVRVKQKGYLYLYVSNENPTQANVYFDDLKVTYHTSIEQLNNYYAFGLAQGSNGFTRQGAVKNPLSYNGKELQDELDLGWLDYGARMYMPELGRWGVIDPLSEKMRRHSPYNYAFDNPIRFIDPDGMTGEEANESLGQVLQTILNYFFGDGDDGTEESAAEFGRAMEIGQAATEQNQAALAEAKESLDEIPVAGFISRMSGAQQAKTPEEMKDELVAAGDNLASTLMIVDGGGSKGGPKPGSKGGPGAGKRFPEKIKDEVRAESGDKCVFCEVETTREPGPNRSNIDHAESKSTGGNNTKENAQNTCQTCNQQKKAMSTTEYLISIGRSIIGL